MYAIVKVGGKQYRVEKGDSIVVDRLSAGEGDKLQLEPLLYRPDGEGDVVFEGDALEKVKIEAVVKGHERGPKLHVLKFKSKKGYKRRSGHRSELTRLEIGEIKLLSRRPGGGGAAKEPAAKKAEAKPAAKKAEPKPPAKKAGTTRARKPAGSSAKDSAHPPEENEDGS